MVESLCNNPDALITPRGLTLKKPCGFWEAEGWGWCNAKDYNDWLAAYKIRIDVAISQMKDLKKVKKAKLMELSEHEQLADAKIKEHVLMFKELQEAAYKDEGNFSSQEYAKKITDITTLASDLNCLIEHDIQSGIESADGIVKPTGLIAGSRKESPGIGTYLGYGVGAATIIFLYKKLS